MALEGYSNSFVFIFRVQQGPIVSYNSLNNLNIDADLLISINPGVVLKAEISKHTNLQYEYECQVTRGVNSYSYSYS